MNFPLIDLVCPLAYHDLPCMDDSQICPSHNLRSYKRILDVCCFNFLSSKHSIPFATVINNNQIITMDPFNPNNVPAHKYHKNQPDTQRVVPQSSTSVITYDHTFYYHLATEERNRRTENLARRGFPCPSQSDELTRRLSDIQIDQDPEAPDNRQAHSYQIRPVAPDNRQAQLYQNRPVAPDNRQAQPYQNRPVVPDNRQAQPYQNRPEGIRGENGKVANVRQPPQSSYPYPRVGSNQTSPTAKRTVTLATHAPGAPRYHPQPPPHPTQMPVHHSSEQRPYTPSREPRTTAPSNPYPPVTKHTSTRTLDAPPPAPRTTVPSYPYPPITQTTSSTRTHDVPPRAPQTTASSNPHPHVAQSASSTRPHDAPPRAPQTTTPSKPYPPIAQSTSSRNLDAPPRAPQTTAPYPPVAQSTSSRNLDAPPRAPQTTAPYPPVAQSTSSRNLDAPPRAPQATASSNSYPPATQSTSNAVASSSSSTSATLPRRKTRDPGSSHIPPPKLYASVDNTMFGHHFPITYIINEPGHSDSSSFCRKGKDYCCVSAPATRHLLTGSGKHILGKALNANSALTEVFTTTVPTGSTILPFDAGRNNTQRKGVGPLGISILHILKLKPNLTPMTMGPHPFDRKIVRTTDIQVILEIPGCPETEEVMIPLACDHGVLSLDGLLYNIAYYLQAFLVVRRKPYPPLFRST
ncbi:hypothetical protein E1B28_008140 [Marasmius oreades]|uniref:Uncharacterized protein n=1 Tax=Marasmius oreades TaxID=181124 RepID=A0A9P7RXX5_9AGAR|nr:uncharacterized protein E1B28_008140 [Marasmius oreades]KAG7091739.1 hypothetical protein E1B28_008140 [Marasmius oreades]